MSLRLVISVQFSCLDTQLSQSMNEPSVKVSLSLVLSGKFFYVDTQLLQSTNYNKNLLNSLILTPDSHRLLTRLC